MAPENKNNDIEQNDLAAMRQTLLAMLPQATQRAVEAYQVFAQQDAAVSAKDFTAHHAACKAALAHVDYLTKLAQWVNKNSINPDKPDDQEAELNKAMQAARLRLLQVEQNHHAVP